MIIFRFLTVISEFVSWMDYCPRVCSTFEPIVSVIDKESDWERKNDEWNHCKIQGTFGDSIFRLILFVIVSIVYDIHKVSVMVSICHFNHRAGFLPNKWRLVHGDIFIILLPAILRREQSNHTKIIPR